MNKILHTIIHVFAYLAIAIIVTVFVVGVWDSVVFLTENYHLSIL